MTISSIGIASQFMRQASTAGSGVSHAKHSGKHTPPLPCTVNLPPDQENLPGATSTIGSGGDVPSRVAEKPGSQGRVSMYD